MSELAFNFNGERFDVPASATGWRVRRMPGRGSKAVPEIVYGREGTPLVLPLDAGMDDLQREVDEPGRYRLDPVDDRGAPIEKAQYAYIHVRAPSTPAPLPLAASSGTIAEHVLIEAIRHNSELARQSAELARSVIERFPQMMASAAQLIAAADGAGLPARPPIVSADDDEDEDDEPADAPAERPDLMSQLASLAPIAMMILGGKGGIELPSLAEMLDWRKAYASGQAKREGESAPTDANNKLVQVVAALSPEERAIAMKLAGALSPDERAGVMAELAPLPVEEARGAHPCRAEQGGRVVRNKQESETPLQRVGYTAGGAAASAFVGGYLAKKGWAPKTVASALAALGAGLTWKGESDRTKSVGSGVMGASTGQFVLELFIGFDQKRAATGDKPSNASLPRPGALEASLERARARLAATQS